ncbi:MAG: CpaF family protein [Anaerolineaceae bacterium]|nr:CpaF family protein [Anaerolineaceae bacterium]
MESNREQSIRTTKQMENRDSANLFKVKNEMINSLYEIMMVGMVRSSIQGSDFIDSKIRRIVSETRYNLSDEQRDYLFDELIEHVASYGPIEPFLNDPQISEVMVNGPDLVFIEKDGQIIETDVKYDNDFHVILAINHILRPLGRFVDYDHPTVDARLPDGSRVNVVIPPVSHKGPCITIRKFLVDKLTIEQIVDLGSMTHPMAEFLEACVKSRLNIVISGNTSSGKTTLLNIMSGFIPNNERIITIEDSAELSLKQKHVISLESKPANPDGKGEVTIRDLVRNSLRMRPDRIVVGEVRGGESLDMLQAMNTGHDGSLTTVHSNSPRDTISRLETMAMMAGLEMPIRAIRKQVSSAIQLIVHQSRLLDGSRKTTHVSEVVGMEGDTVTLMDIFRFNQKGIDKNGKIIGDLQATGLRPQFTPQLEAYGFKLGARIFAPRFR